MKPIIIGSVPVRETKDALDILSKRGHSGDLIELRLDYLPSIDYGIFNKIKNFRDIVILTVRAHEEGGVYDIQRDERKDFLMEAIASGFKVDAEISLMSDFEDLYPFIASAHFVNRVPDEISIQRKIDSIRGKCSYVKIAYKPNNRSKAIMFGILSKNDNIAVMELGGEPINRVAFSLLGSRLIYCHIGEPTANGQMNCLRVRNIIDCLWENND